MLDRLDCFGRFVACAVIAAGSLIARADEVPRVHIDGVGDSRLLRFDGMQASPPDAPLIDMVRYRIGAWTPDDATDTLFRGQWDLPTADFFRLDLVFAGLVNPPGLGFPANIFFFGDNPLLGFVEFDVDANVLTGGELLGPQFRYHGAASRFGSPLASPRFSGRMALDSCPGSYDADISTGPYFPERSGEEFDLAFLWGSIGAVDVGSNGDFSFDPGEAWVVHGPFLNRAHGFDDFILVCCSNGLPSYMPQVDLLFSHSVATDRTTVSLVYPLTQDGSASITGDAAEPPDCCADNQNSIQEGLEHVSFSAQLATAMDRADVNFPLIEGWEFQTPTDYMNPKNWELNATFVSVFTDPDTLIPGLAWSDVVPNVRLHDYDGDSVVDSNDVSLFDTFLATADGGACDADGVVDGVFSVIDPGNGFDVHDVNDDGVVDSNDRPTAIDTSALFDADNDGDLDLHDYAIIQRCIPSDSGFQLPDVCDAVDVNDDGTVTTIEIQPFAEAMAGPQVILFQTHGLMQE